MAYDDNDEMRTKIREALGALMDGPPAKGAVAIANDIKRKQKTLGITGAPSHDTITRVQKGEHVGRTRLEWIYVYLVHSEKLLDPSLSFGDGARDPVFQTLVHQFVVRKHNLDDCERMQGKFGLYFNSEDIHDSVVMGAIEFSYNAASKSFEVTELQSSTLPPRIERWTGYYFHRRERYILVMRGESRHLRHTPKFYVLNTPHVDHDDGVSEIGGKMLKLGSGGSYTGGSFSTKVLLRRSPEAFGKCEVVPRSKVPPNILREIDP
jgi:hypothetical protein